MRRACTSCLHNNDLFLSEADVARRHGQTPANWAAKVRILERAGFPRIDPIMNGRFMPAIEAFWCRRYSLSSIEVFQPDGGENLEAL